MNISGKSIEELRKILEAEHGKKYTVQQAKNLGQWLIKFYGHLADKKGTSEARDGNPKLTTGTTDKTSK